ncbi:MAG: sigma-E processing peptidase SpoIIGA [Clostridia bacterium]|nr:sigma-E processing peptidase SpoIIGA [Clostridia bacterium]
MIIYADILFLLNGAITYITLILTAVILKTPLKRLKVLCSALLGGAYALTVLIEMPAFVSLPIKIIVCALLIWIAFGRLPPKQFLMHILLFLCLNVFIGGIVLLLSLADKVHFYSNLYVSYIDISPLHLLIALVITYLAVSIISRLIRKKRMQASIYKVRFEFQEKAYTLFGFCDSGNNLCEPFSALPVCLVKSDILKDFEKEEHKRVIPFTSLGGEGIVYAVKVQLSIEQGKGKDIKATAYLAQSESAFKDMQYDIILNPKLFQQTENI